MKKMKNIWTILIVLISINLYAQDDQGDKSPTERPQREFHDKRPPVKERMDAMKIGFITNRLNLTSEEAKVFWPVYNKYSDELEQLRKNRRENLIDAKQKMDEMSDAEIEKAVDNEIIFRQNELEILKKYHPQFKKILPIRKVGQLYKAEEEFKRKLLEMIQDRRDDRQEQHGPPPGK
jgi:hypothetical protein